MFSLLARHKAEKGGGHAMGNKIPSPRFKRPDTHIICSSTSFTQDFLDAAATIAERHVSDLQNVTPETPRSDTSGRELGWSYRETERYVFFMEGFLHQWYTATMVFDDVQYNCCEQYMMGQKATLFGDTKSAEKLLQCENPLDQKLIGRNIKNFDETKWRENRFEIVYRGNLAKFKQNKHLRDKLLSYPHSVEFVNANPIDQIWGIGVGVFDRRVTDPHHWSGLNLLGKIITKIRNVLVPAPPSTPHLTFKQKEDQSLFITTAYVRIYIEMEYGMAIPFEVVCLLSKLGDYGRVVLRSFQRRVYTKQGKVLKLEAITSDSNDELF